MFSYKTPLLFSIPLDVYSDEVEKIRDKKSYLKIQKLAKKCEQLRQKLDSCAEQRAALIEKTGNLLLQTMEFSNNIRGRRIE